MNEDQGPVCRRASGRLGCPQEPGLRGSPPSQGRGRGIAPARFDGPDDGLCPGMGSGGDDQIFDRVAGEFGQLFTGGTDDRIVREGEGTQFAPNPLPDAPVAGIAGRRAERSRLPSALRSSVGCRRGDPVDPTGHRHG